MVCVGVCVDGGGGEGGEGWWGDGWLFVIGSGGIFYHIV